MSEPRRAYATTPIEPGDPEAGFSCGKRALDDYFARHALANDEAGIGRAYVLRREPGEPVELPGVLGYYTLSMALADSSPVSSLLEAKLPRYPMPVALVGRLAVDLRARGRRVGEKLLVDALNRIVDASRIIGCLGVIVDAKDPDGEGFYSKYGFVSIAADGWPKRMFLPMATAISALGDD